LQTDVIVPAGIRLGQFLKWIGIASTGGGSKLLIQSGAVQVNGRTETRRGRLLQNGDVICAAGRRMKIIIENMEG